MKLNETDTAFPSRFAHPISPSLSSSIRIITILSSIGVTSVTIIIITVISTITITVVYTTNIAALFYLRLFSWNTCIRTNALNAHCSLFSFAYHNGSFGCNPHWEQNKSYHSYWNLYRHNSNGKQQLAWLPEKQLLNMAWMHVERK